MSKKHIKNLLLLLLLVLPSLLQAQTLTQFQYWFDDDYAARKTGTISGTETTISRSIDTESLEVGIHRFNIRVKQSDGKYSAVSTTVFQKVASGEPKWLEYWFDGNHANCKRIEGTPASDGNGYTFVNEFDVSELSIGKHQVSFRSVNNNGSYCSAVSTATFFKQVSGDAKWLEYWIDDDQASSRKIQGTPASDGNGYTFVNDLDMSSLPVGHHRLSLRAVSNNGLVSSAVTTTPFIKTGSGEVQWLEYWVDGEISHSKKIKGTPASDGNGYNFVNEFDGASLSPGYHRFYYRAVNDDNTLTTAITSTPVIVKSRYSSLDDVKLQGYSISIDNQEPIVTAATSAAHETLIRNDLNLRQLSEGQHQFKMNVWNELGVGVRIDTTFSVGMSTCGTSSCQPRLATSLSIYSLAFFSFPLIALTTYHFFAC